MHKFYTCLAMSLRILEMSKDEFYDYVCHHLRAVICVNIWCRRRIQPSCSHCLKVWEKEEDYNPLFEDLFYGKHIQPSCSHCQREVTSFISNMVSLISLIKADVIKFYSLFPLLDHSFVLPRFYHILAL